MRLSRSYSILSLVLVFVLGAGCGAPVVSVPTDMAIVCTAPQTLCGEECTDTSSDARNCGACGKACDAGFVCVMGACAVYCPGGTSSCDHKSCVNFQSDREHCGDCMTACPAGKVCSMGKCALSCATSLTDCNGGCVNLNSDDANCGACATQCAAGNVCTMGKCALSCQKELLNCAGVCANAMSDPTNCGKCGNVCPNGNVCSSGACALSCQQGLSNCNGSCADLLKDTGNCGKCGTVCPNGNVCSAGKCALSCQQGLSNCGGTCVNLQSDGGNCGACGTVCMQGTTCVGSACKVTCGGGETQCGGMCTNTAFDPTNCGTCANVCTFANATPACSAGKCVMGPCNAGFGDCNGNPADGCEVDLTKDLKNCGACGAACGAVVNGVAACVKSVCAIASCTAPYANCDMKFATGCNINTATDSANCGACAMACPNLQSCKQSVCQMVGFHVNGIFYVSDATYLGDFNKNKGFCTALLGTQAYIAGNNAILPNAEKGGTWNGNNGNSNSALNCSLYSSQSANDTGYGVSGGYGACSQSRHVVCSTDPAYCNGYGIQFCPLWN